MKFRGDVLISVSKSGPDCYDVRIDDEVMERGSLKLCCLWLARWLRKTYPDDVARIEDMLSRTYHAAKRSGQ